MSKRPYQSRIERIIAAEKIRSKAATAPHAGQANTLETEQNTDEDKFSREGYPASFTKGLQHDKNGMLTDTYSTFREAINGPPEQDFENVRPNATLYVTKNKKGEEPGWRGWESPRTGHYHDLEGPDADAVGMAPAPVLGSAELSLEMAEVYAMALLRDIPFTELEAGTGKDKQTGIATSAVVEALQNTGLFDLRAEQQANRRLAARLQDPDQYYIDQPVARPLPGVSPANLFKGSGPGAKTGHFVSQFMLAGSKLDGPDSVKTDPKDGYIRYGNQFIDQRGTVFQKHIDHMINWDHWLDVQNGANLGSAIPVVAQRFITTPRDLASYVRFDALYQAYLNACLILLSHEYPTQPGFPEQGNRPRTGFASFGGPHILSLVTEVATRCLKAARRQKFNFHRRARPERIGGLITLAAANPSALGTHTRAALQDMLVHLSEMLPLVAQHNEKRINNPSPDLQLGKQVKWLDGKNKGYNFLLPMAFAEGSPMHPAYAAGHATVAGGCVTMLKAFFRTLDDHGNPLPWKQEFGEFVPDQTCDQLERHGPSSDLTVEGELNKLAANISIGRNMAGVHYYSDYYDSLRMGERVAVGILMEQLLTYENLCASNCSKEEVLLVFRSFDGDLIKMSSLDPFNPEITHKGHHVDYLSWFGRHTPPYYGNNPVGPHPSDKVPVKYA